MTNLTGCYLVFKPLVLLVFGSSSAPGRFPSGRVFAKDKILSRRPDRGTCLFGSCGVLFSVLLFFQIDALNREKSLVPPVVLAPPHALVVRKTQQQLELLSEQVRELLRKSHAPPVEGKHFVFGLLDSLSALRLHEGARQARVTVWVALSRTGQKRCEELETESFDRHYSDEW